MTTTEPKNEIAPYVKRANLLVIATHEDAQNAAAFLKDIKGMMKVIEDHNRPGIDSAHKHWKQLLARNNADLEPLEAADKVVRAKVLAYEKKQAEEIAAENLRREREAQAIAEAQRQRELEAAKAEAARQKAERDRIQAELDAANAKAAAEAAERAKVEAARQAEEAKRIAASRSAAAAEKARQEAETRRLNFERTEKERLQAQADAQARQIAELKRAEEARLQAVRDAREIAATEAVAAPVVVVEAPKIAGQSFSKVWKYEVIDAALVPDEFKVIDEVRLGKYAKAMGPMAKVAGVKFFQVDQLRVMKV